MIKQRIRNTFIVCAILSFSSGECPSELPRFTDWRLHCFKPWLFRCSSRICREQEERSVRGVSLSTNSSLLFSGLVELFDQQKGIGRLRLEVILNQLVQQWLSGLLTIGEKRLQKILPDRRRIALII